MGEIYINDLFRNLPHHLARSMNAAKLLTSQTNYEIMVTALEKYFQELGIGGCAERIDPDSHPLNTSLQPRETGGGLKFFYQKVRINCLV